MSSSPVDDSSDVETAFARLAATLEAEVGDASVRAPVLARFRAAFERPPADALSAVLRRGVGAAKARELLFAPCFDDDACEGTGAGAEDGMRLYPLLIAGPPPGAAAPAGSAPAQAQAQAQHPARTSQVTCLALLYFWHLRDWRRARAFVLGGGLAALAALVSDASPQIASQAVECLLQLTSHERYDWFLGRGGDDEVIADAGGGGGAGAGAPAPPPAPRPLALSREDARLHEQMLHLGRASPRLFLGALLDRFEAPWPGGSHRCLMLLAFWLSWARRLHCGGRPLRLSPGMLARIGAWAAREARPEGAGAGAAAVEGEDFAATGAGALVPAQRFSTPAERELAARLFEDFSRFPAPEEPAQVARREAGAVDGATDGAGADGAGARAGGVVVAGLAAPIIIPAAPHMPSSSPSHPTASAPALAPAPAPSDPLSRAAALKAEGNALFRDAAWRPAARAYSRALDELGLGAGKSAGAGAGETDFAAGAACAALPAESVYADSGADGIGGTGAAARRVRDLGVALLSNRAACHLRAAGFGGELLPSPSFLAKIGDALRAAPDLRRALRAGDGAAMTAALSRFDHAGGSARASPPHLALPPGVGELLLCVRDATAACTLAEAESGAKAEAEAMAKAEPATASPAPVPVAKVLLRKAQALCGLGCFEDASAVARACIAGCRLRARRAAAAAAGSTSAGEGKGTSAGLSAASAAGGEAGVGAGADENAALLESQAGRLLTLISALQQADIAAGERAEPAAAADALPAPAGGPGGVNDGEDDAERAVLAALLSRPEFGGGGGGGAEETQPLPPQAIAATHAPAPQAPASEAPSAWAALSNAAAVASTPAPAPSSAAPATLDSVLRGGHRSGAARASQVPAHLRALLR